MADHATAGTKEYSWCNPPSTDFERTATPSPQPMTGFRWSDALPCFRRIRHTRTQAAMRSTAVVMRYPRFQDRAQMPVVRNNWYRVENN